MNIPKRNEINLGAIDIETAGDAPGFGLQPWRLPQGKARISSIALEFQPRAGANQPTVVSYSNPTVDQIAEILDIIIENDLHACGWNTIFDLSWLWAFEELRPRIEQISWLDGMLLTMHAERAPPYLKNAQQYGLKQQTAEKIPDLAGYEAGVDFDDDSEEGADRLQAYNRMDVHVTRRLAEKAISNLNDLQLRTALIEAQALVPMAAANFRGIDINLAAIEESRETLEKNIDDLLDKLSEWGVTLKTVGSNPMMCDLLFKQWGHPILARSEKTGAPSTGKAVLARLTLRDPRVGDLRRLREYKGLRKKYVTNIADSVAYNEDGRIHALVRPYATYTGRCSYSSQVKASETKDGGDDAGAGKKKSGPSKAQVGMALHQVKRDDAFRRPFVAPEGYVMLEMDAAGQEYRWMAILSGDANMLARCADGEDPHSFMGSLIAGISYEQLYKGYKAGDKVAEKQRHLGKVANLSLQFRTGVDRFREMAFTQYGLQLTQAEAENTHAKYRQAYPSVPKFWQQTIMTARRNGFVENLAGRRCQLTKAAAAWDGEHKWQLESTSINFPVQSTAADQKFLALSALRPLQCELGLIFSHDLHDGLFFLAPEDGVNEIAAKVKHTLDNLDYAGAWGLKPPVPLPWDGKVGKSWGDMRKI